jgi:4'-phosphopantetheinyl transferase EntD
MAAAIHRAAVALATVEDLPESARNRGDAERRASRVAARRAIRGILGANVAIELRGRVSRGPAVRIRGTSGAPPVLSLSHRDGKAAAIAAPAGQRVGIDVERLVPPPMDEAHARRFLTTREQRCAVDLPPAVLWSLKEAFWKALDLDGSVAFRELELDIDRDAQVCGVYVRNEWRRAAATIAAPWPGYVMAVVSVESAR